MVQPTARDDKTPSIDSVESIPRDEQDHLRGLPLASLLVGLLLVILITTLDISILSTAIPRITDEFDSIADIGWYASAYLLTQTSLVPLAGRCYALFPFKTTFLSFLALFEIGSLLCGVAQSSIMLTIGRAVCGMGASGLFNGAMTIIGIVSPPGQKAMALGIVMALFSLGQILGPLIGGSLTQHASWRWCFYINLPVGAVATLCLAFISLPSHNKTTWKVNRLVWELDLPGVVIFAPACVMLLLALNWAGTEYAWRSTTTIGLLCGSGITFVMFVFWERRQKDQAMMPSSIIKRRPVAFSLFVALFQGGSMLILTFYLPLYLQTVQGMSPTRSGVYLLSTFVPQVFTAVVVGWIVSKTGLALPEMLVGHGLVTISYGLLSTLKPGSSQAEWIGYQVIAGTMLVVQAVVEKTELAIATAVLMWAQFIGMAVFVSVAQTIFVSTLKTALQDFAPSVDAGRAIEAGATAFAASVPAEIRPGVLKAYSKAITSTSYLGVALSTLALTASIGIWNTRVEMKIKDTAPVAEKSTIEGDKGLKV